MKIALYHGYELGGSGSNEYTRYLAVTLAKLGHEVMVICADLEPESYDFLSRAVAYDKDGTPTELFSRENKLPAPMSLHQIPRTSVYPVYITDKQRSGTVKAFHEMSDAEIDEYHQAMVKSVTRALSDEKPDVLHANHLVYQPIVAVEACKATGTPFYIVPHGSSIEYTVNEDKRFLDAGREGLKACKGIAWIAREVRDRVFKLYPELDAEIRGKSHMVGVGTDTSLFSPVDKSARSEAIAELKSMHRPGGKTAAQRQELKDALDKGEIKATQGYWNAYNHKLEDDDLPAILDGIPIDEDIIFFVGAMTYGKGIQSLIAAMPGVLARRPKTHLVLVGSGTYREVLEALCHALQSGNLELFDQLVAQGKDLERQKMSGPLEDLAAYAAKEENRVVLKEHGPKLAGHVHFIGRLDHPRLKCIFPCAKIGAFPSVIKEASPLVFMESLANAVLPSGSYHSGLRDGLDDLKEHIPDAIWQRMKFEVEPATRIATMADNLATMLDELEKRELGPDLRKLAVDRYDWTAVAESLAAIAQMIIK